MNEYTQMANKLMKRCLNSLVIREIQIKTITHPIRMIKMKKTKRQGYGQGYGATETLVY